MDSNDDTASARLRGTSGDESDVDQQVDAAAASAPDGPGNELEPVGGSWWPACIVVAAWIVFVVFAGIDWSESIFGGTITTMVVMTLLTLPIFGPFLVLAVLHAIPRTPRDDEPQL